MKRVLKKNLSYFENRIETMRKKLAQNSVSDDVRAEVEARISTLETLADEMRTALAQAEEGDADASEELKGRVEEIIARVSEVENAMKRSDKIVKNIAQITNSKAFVSSFYETIKNSTNAQEFRENWRAKVKEFIKNDIDPANVEDFLPAMVVREINDQFVGKRHRLLELVDWTGLPCFKALEETGNELANTHGRGTQKTEQTLTFSGVEIRPKYIYKYITIDKELERESKDSGDILIRFITRELLDRLLTTIERKILAPAANDPFIAPKEVQFAGGIVDALAYMDDTEGAVAIMSPTVYLQTKQAVTALNNRLATHDDVLAYLGVEEIILSKAAYTPTTGTFSGIWFLRPSDYKLVGDRRPDEYTDFNLAFNKLEYLTEIWIGGGCVKSNNFLAMLAQ